MKKFLIAFPVLFLVSSAAYSAKLSCVADTYNAHDYLQLALSADGLSIKISGRDDMVKPDDLLIESSGRGSDQNIVISGRIRHASPVACAGACPKETFQLEIGSHPSTQANSVLTLSTSMFDEKLGIVVKSSEPLVFACDQAGFGLKK